MFTHFFQCLPNFTQIWLYFFQRVLNVEASDMEKRSPPKEDDHVKPYDRKITLEDLSETPSYLGIKMAASFLGIPMKENTH